MPPRWLELTVQADHEAVEAVSEILGRVSQGTAVRPAATVTDPTDELAVQADPVAGYLVSAHIPDDPAAAAMIETTERALWHLQAFGLRPVGELRVRSVEDDWTDAWRAHYVPQRIGRVVVVPSWAEEALRPGEVAVRMDPGMAFGTGLHPTTRGSVTLLQEGGPMPMPHSVLDVGCGSGILALAALRLGAERAVAYDTDELAVRATRANAALNGLEARLTVRHGSLPQVPEERHPLVLANLVASLLVELAPRLADHTAPGGRMVAGGIVSPRGGEVTSALQAAGFAVRHRIDDGEWLSLVADHAPDGT
jgi:ribosomal protein L11 methyltransferase